MQSTGKLQETHVSLAATSAKHTHRARGCSKQRHSYR